MQVQYFHMKEPSHARTHVICAFGDAPTIRRAQLLSPLSNFDVIVCCPSIRL